MAWLRIDDRFAENRKIAALTDKQFRVWIRVLCYCARQRSPHLDKDAHGEIVGLTRDVVTRFVMVGLLEEDGGGHVVHDWTLYNGETVEERVVAYLDKHPTAKASEVYKAIGGKKQLVLSEYARISGSQQVPERFPEGSPTVPAVVPERFPSGSPRARARTPTQEELKPSPVPVTALQDAGTGAGTEFVSTGENNTLALDSVLKSV